MSTSVFTGRKAQELKRLMAGIFFLAPARRLLARVDRRYGPHEQMHELGLFRRSGLAVNVFQVCLGGALTDPKRLSRVLDAKSWRHSEEHTYLARCETIEPCKGLACQGRHNDRTLHEDCHHGDAPAGACTFAACEREDGGD